MKRKTQKNKGSSLLLALLVLSTVLVIAFGMSRLMLGEIKLSKNIPQSLKAYYAAETGIEKFLYDARKGGGAVTIAKCSILLDNNASYGVEIDTDKGITTIKSWGCYKDIRRAIEVSY